MNEQQTPQNRPGFKTTEFWLALVAALLGGAVASGLLPAGWPAQVAGAVLTALASLGYGASRAKVKSAWTAAPPDQNAST